MKNLKYFPFERNRYFYGKLMTVADFEIEQRYGNDKRRLQNRLFQGVGVVCGLNVVQVDDTVISLEPGVALDALGHEIVVEEPVIKKLAMIPGFDQAQDNATLYLCIEYDEREHEPVYSIAGATAQQEGINYNKISESYKLMLTDQEPDLRGASLEELYMQSIVVVKQNGVRVTLKLPRYVRPGELFNVGVVIEKLRQSQPVELDMLLHLTCATDDSGSYELPIHFSEAQRFTRDRYELSYTIRAASMKETSVGLRISQEGFSCKLGERALPVSVQVNAAIEMCEEEIERRVIREYAELGLDDIASASTLLPVVLAKIQVVGTVTAYAIDAVQTLPFDQMVITAPLRTAIERVRETGLQLRQSGSGAWEGGGAKGAPSENAGNDIGDARCGIAVIDVPFGARAGDKLYSKEMAHGLGLGYVSMQAGIVQQGAGYQPVAFGDASMFTADQGFQTIAGNVSVLAYPDKGTFVIAVQLNRNINDGATVSLRWWAFRDVSMRSLNIRQKSLALRPDMAYVAVRESVMFEVVAHGLASSDCTFAVKEAEGGVIEQNGKYTAPGQPGVYEVIAQSIADPEFKASAFIVVRENH